MVMWSFHRFVWLSRLYEPATNQLHDETTTRPLLDYSVNARV